MMFVSDAANFQARGFLLTFDLAQATPNIPTASGALTPFDAPDCTVQHRQTTAHCYGEILSYKTASEDTKACLQQALLDLAAGKLEYEKLNGRFLLVIRDDTQQEWQIVTDRLGAMHCYWVRRGDRIIALGSHLAAVVRHASDKTLDWEALASFFAFGFFLDEQTHYTDVSILPPHSVYHVGDDGRLRQQQRYWEWQHRVDAARSYGETLEEYDMLLKQAMRRCTVGGEVALPISGGLDSRSLAAVAERDSIAQAYSYGYSANSVEIKLGRRVAQSKGFDFTAHVIDDYLFERLDEIVLALHGSQDVTQARQASISGWLQEHADAVVTGLWGDVWCEQSGLVNGLSVPQQAVHKFEKRGRQWLIDKLLPQSARIDIAAMLNDKVAQGLARFEAIVDEDFRLKAYKTAQWAFRWSNASLGGFELGATPRIPYYDIDLVDFFCTVPTAFVRQRRLQIDHLKRYAPDMARIRWQQAEANLYLARYGYWLSLPRRVLKRAYNVVAGAQPLQRNWELQFLTTEGEEQLRRWLLRPATELLEYVSPATIEDLLADFYARPDAANGYTVSMLLTFAAWLEGVSG